MGLGLEMDARLLSAFVAALATGFLGSLHCISMCGATIASAMQRRTGSANLTGRSSAVTMVHVTVFSPSLQNASMAPTHRQTMGGNAALMRASLAFNAGRITSYMVAGALVAGVASGIAARLVINDLTPLRLALFVFGQCLIIATGLYIAGMTKLLVPFERAGQWFWQRLQRWVGPRLHTHFIDGQAQPFAFGALWGWIPCGLVYGTLATAMASGSAENGALIMLAFGLGTLPAMLTASAAAVPMRKLAQMPRARIAAGMIVVGLGLLGLSRAAQLSDFAALARLCLGSA